MMQKGNGLPDQANGRFIKPAAQGNRSVPIHFPDDVDAEVIMEIRGRLPDQMGMFEIPGNRGLVRAGVDGGMIFLIKPLCQFAV
ncbi:MAG: hypothetical protein BWX44_01572 [Spirochaetes bacterium ADurb.Bin001]|nr:MAG: hypothetical protein BWX44_01572 [Spirochaetes bacterium ADurb.Bin001]